MNSAAAPPLSQGAPIPIVALDVPTLRDAFRLLERVGPRAEWVKVGLQLFVAGGPDLVEALRTEGYRVFLDLKLHDIPNTVARAAASAARLDVELLTLHASGGRAMMAAAREAVGDDGPGLLAVTVLTSHDRASLAEAWGGEERDVADEVLRLAALAAEARMDGLVASVAEAGALRARWGSDLLLLTPGIRLPGDAAGDQSRVATPAHAAAAGADYVVIGRSVTGAADPAAAFARVLRDLGHAEVVGV
jgi:orotidine-5'-phosphate decarboxylase